MDIQQAITRGVTGVRRDYLYFCAIPVVFTVQVCQIDHAGVMENN
jgi:hypothetical protein